ncbi:MAG TPA: hypothetical protein VK401_03425 [Propionibacteriaceae bacterium]|nr:hypothetical protein [Propionibacteriaceae bacterium]
MPTPPGYGSRRTSSCAGNLASFAPDGAATCAFVYPSCVNGPCSRSHRASLPGEYAGHSLFT